MFWSHLNQYIHYIFLILSSTHRFSCALKNVKMTHKTNKQYVTSNTWPPKYATKRAKCESTPHHHLLMHYSWTSTLATTKSYWMGPERRHIPAGGAQQKCTWPPSEYAAKRANWLFTPDYHLQMHDSWASTSATTRPHWLRQERCHTQCMRRTSNTKQDHQNAAWPSGECSSRINGAIETINMSNNTRWATMYT